MNEQLHIEQEEETLIYLVYIGQAGGGTWEGFVLSQDD